MHDDGRKDGFSNKVGRGGVSCTPVGPSKGQLMALLRRRIDELRQMSLKIRITTVLLDGVVSGDEEIRRITLALQRLEKLRRLHRRNEAEEVK